MKDRIVLAYTGDATTSVAIAWLSQQYAAEVVALTLDLGQGSELEGVRDRALASGAVRAHVLDVREEFARGYLLPSLQAGVLCRDGYPMGAALARPLIAKTLVEVAGIEHATAIAHGEADASDAAALETLVRGLNAGLPLLAPVREWAMTADEAVEYARLHGVLVSAVARGRECVNLWGRSVPVANSTDRRADAVESRFVLTRSGTDGPETPASVAIGFEHGIPVSVNGVPMPLTELIESLTLIAGQHGVGRLEWTAPRQDGTVHHEISEAPAAHVLHSAHAEVEALVLPKDLVAVQHELCLPYTDLIRDGRWFTPLREALDTFHTKVQAPVTGMSVVQLFQGQARLIAPEMVSHA